MTKVRWLVISALLLSACSSKKTPQGPGVGPGLGAYPQAVAAADEGFAIQSLRIISTAQAQAKIMRGSYGDFNTLTQAGLLDSRFASGTPNLKGYQFTMTASDADFSVRADPQSAPMEPSKTRHFYLDSSDNAIHVNASGPASKIDPILGAQQ